MSVVRSKRNITEQLMNPINQYRKGMATYKNESRINECFYYDNSECEGRIKQAHSIQRNGRLTLVEGDVKGNKMVYTPTSHIPDETYLIKTLKPIGKQEASTFYGFCDRHDSQLFAPIENFPFDESDQHLFLHSYRSFAHSCHRKKEEYKALTQDGTFRDTMSVVDLQRRIAGADLGLKDALYYREKLNDLLRTNQYGGLEYFYHVFPQSYPLAFASAFTPYFTPSNLVINSTKTGEWQEQEPLKTMMMTVFPGQDETVAILACFPEDKQCVTFLDELQEMKEQKLERFKRVLSSIILEAGENLFFAPQIWEKLGAKGQRQLCDELIKSATDLPKSFKISQIGFFDPRFTRKNLGMP